MKKLWAVLTVLVLVIVVGTSVMVTLNGRPLSPFAMFALAGYSCCYAVARIAEAWRIKP